ncbi:MAG: hypothetical protein ACE5I1_08990 [bacterium]
MEKRITAFFDGRFLRPEFPGQLKMGYKYELIIEDEMETGTFERQGWLLDETRQDFFEKSQAKLKKSFPEKPQLKKTKSKRKRKKRR